MLARGWRYGRSETRRRNDGARAFELGFKTGYWPCLRGPFITVVLGYHRHDFWYGLPSKKDWPCPKPES